MKRGKFTPAQTAFVLKQVEDGTSIAGVSRKSRNYCSDVLQLAQEVCGPGAVRDEAFEDVDEENARLERLVADLSPDKAMARLCPPLVRGQRRADVINRKRQGLLVAVCPRVMRQAMHQNHAAGAPYADAPDRPEVINQFSPTSRPGLRNASGKSRRRVCAMDTGASTSFSVMRAGR